LSTGNELIYDKFKPKCAISGSDDNINLLISDGDDVGLVSSSVDTTAVVWRYTEGKVIC
jgi:translation initiation factor IF-1